MVDCLSIPSSQPSMPTYSRQILMTLGPLFWNVSKQFDKNRNFYAKSDKLCTFMLCVHEACGVAHQALEGIEPKGQDILVQGQQ